jgi:hypothetical protein
MSAEKQTKEKGKPPVGKFKDGLITVSLWEKAGKEGRVFHEVSIERRYQDASGDWRTSGSVPGHKIQTLRKLLDMAHTEILNAGKAAPQEESEAEE